MGRVFSLQGIATNFLSTLWGRQYFVRNKKTLSDFIKVISSMLRIKRIIYAESCLGYNAIDEWHLYDFWLN